MEQARRAAADGGTARVSNAAAAAAAGAAAAADLEAEGDGRSPPRASPAADVEAAGAPALGGGDEVCSQSPHARELRRAGLDQGCAGRAGKAAGLGDRPLIFSRRLAQVAPCEEACGGACEERRRSGPLSLPGTVPRRERSQPAVAGFASVAACAALQTTEAKNSHLLCKVGRFLAPASHYTPPVAACEYGKFCLDEGGELNFRFQDNNGSLWTRLKEWRIDAVAAVGG